MGGFNKDRARSVLNLPDTIEPVTMMTAGYLGDESVLPDHLLERETKQRERKEMQEFVFKGKWGRS